MKKAIRNLVIAASMLPLFGVAGGTTAFAQVNEQHRVNQLQEQVRDLTGKLEELNFQMLQMQEQMRKTQEDNEYRFQELEKQKKADAGSRSSTKTAAADSAAVSSPQNTVAVQTENDNQAQKNMAANDTDAASVAAGEQSPVIVETQAPRALGSIRFDASGNVIGGSMNAGEVPKKVVALPQTDNPNELYNAAYDYILAGDYPSAEVAFRAHIDRYPADPMTSDARYWLGESLYGQGRYAEAATVFIDMQRDFPDAKRGAESMLKLGMTMAKLNDRDVACATLAKVGTRYNKAAPAVLKRVAEERKLNRCQ